MRKIGWPTTIFFFSWKLIAGSFDAFYAAVLSPVYDDDDDDDDYGACDDFDARDAGDGIDDDNQKAINDDDGEL